MPRRYPAAILLIHKRPVRDAHQGVVRLVRLRRREVDIVGGDERRVMLVGPTHQTGLRRRLNCQSMTLKFDVEARPEDPLHFRQRRAPLGPATGREQRIDGAIGSPGERNQPLGPADHRLPGHMRRIAGLHIKKSRG